MFCYAITFIMFQNVIYGILFHILFILNTIQCKVKCLMELIHIHETFPSRLYVIQYTDIFITTISSL